MKNLGEGINSPKIDYCPFVDIKNNILYFTSERSLVQSSYKKKLTLQSLLTIMNQGSNGLSRVYSVVFK